MKARGILKNKIKLIRKLVQIFAVKSSSWILKRNINALEMKRLTSTPMTEVVKKIKFNRNKEPTYT